MHFTTAKRDYSLEIDRKSRRGVLRAKRAGMDSALSIDLRRLKQSVTSLPVCASAALASIVVMATADVNGFSRGDAMALCGVSFALIVVLIGVRQFEKSLKNCAAVISGTVVVGISSPGLIVRYLTSGEDTPAYHFVDWQAWVLLGFVCGLAGWSVTQALYSFFTKYMPEAVPAFFRRLLGKFSAPDNKPPPTL